MRYRVITCYRKPKDNLPEDVYFRVEAIEDKDINKFRLASPRYEYVTEEEAIKSLNYDRRPLVLLSGEVVIPFQVNYPKTWDETEILKRWYPGVTESVAGEDYDE